MDDTVSITCIRRGRWHITRDENSAAGPAFRSATSRDEARVIATTLRQEERRALAHESVDFKFGKENARV